MELKYGLSMETMFPKLGSNCTFMELKSASKTF